MNKVDARDKRKEGTETGASLPAVLGAQRSAPRLKRAAAEPQAAEEAIEESLAAALAELDDLELALPSRPSVISVVPQLPATISLAPVSIRPAAQEPPRTTYRIGRKLGVGGMATVYEAMKEGVDGFRKRVALKRIHDHLAEDKRIVELLVDEARLASLITHPNVCQVLDFGVDDCGHFMALEYLDGFTLRQVFNALEDDARQLNSPRHQLVVARMIAGLAEGLHAAHELTDDSGEFLDVVHRDVTPHNLFVLRSGNVKVADFGVARAKNQLHHTATGALKGKLAYSSPEQMHRVHLDRQTDVFALGVVMWELLTGQRLFEAESESATIIQICSEPAPDVRTVQGGIAPSIAAIARKALAINPQERFKTARDMSRALERALAALGDTVPTTDVSDWLQEVMGSPSAPRRVETPADELEEATQTVGTMEIEADPSEPVPPLPSLAPARKAKAGPQQAKPVTAIVVAHDVAAPTLAVVPSARRWPAVLAGALGAGIVSAGVWLATARPWAQSGPAARSPVVAPAPVAPPKVEAPVAIAPVPAATVAATAPVVTPSATVAPIAAAPIAAATPAPPPALSPASRAARSAPDSAYAAPALQQFGSVLVAVSGGTAEVLVDGRNFGTAPQRVTLPAGAHTIALALRGGGVSSAVPIKIEAGASSFVTLPMVAERK